MAHTQDLESAPIWRQWAAITTIAAVLERKVWATTNKGDLYPNFYTLIIGAAGTGKSLAINSGKMFLKELEDTQGHSGLHVAPTSMTMASLSDELADAKRVIVRPGLVPPVIEYNALAIFISEFSSFMHKYDSELIGGLTDIWDGWPYSQRRRGGGLKIKIDSPQLNILAGSTTSNLLKFMPEGAWEQGFASRVLLIYSGDRHYSDIFDDRSLGDAKAASYDDLLADLTTISHLYGRAVFTPEAMAAFRDWRKGGELPTPEHPKLTDYCTRRTAHLIKLCIVASVSRANDLRITLADYEVAKGWLIEAEGGMPDVFRSGSAIDSAAIEETWYYVWAQFAKRKQPVPEHEVVRFVRERVASHSVMRTIEIMEKDGTLKSAYDPKIGQKTFSPAPKRAGPD